LRANGILHEYIEDSGSTTTLIPHAFAKKAELKIHLYPCPSFGNSSVLKNKVRLIGKSTSTLSLMTLAGQVVIRNVPVEITDDDMEEILLGNDLLKTLGINVTSMVDDRSGKFYDMGFDPNDPELEPNLPAAPMEFGENNEEEVRKALHKLVDEALKKGLPEEFESKWRELLQDFADVWRIKMGNDPPAKVPPMKVHWNPETAQPIRYKARRFPLIHRQFMDRMCDKLERFGMHYRNPNARYVSPAYVVAKVPNPENIDTDFRLTIDSREPNKIGLDGQWPMPVLEQVQEHLHGAKFFIGLDLKDGYFQCPLDESCQELYSFATHRCVYTPTRVTQGSSGAVLYFQSTMQQSFKGLLYKNLIIWLDDFLLYASSIEELFLVLRKILEICREIGLKLAVLKCKLFEKEIKWCGQIITPQGMKVDPVRIDGLTSLTLPETAGDLMKFLYAANWIRTSLPEFARVSAPLQEKLDIALKKTKRTKRVAKGIKLCWGEEEKMTFERVKTLIKHAVMTSHPDPNAELVLMTDASEKAWSIVLMQVRDYDDTKGIKDQELEPLYFLSGTFKGASANWAIVEKEAFPIIESLSRLRHLLLRPKGFRLLCDHRNLCFLFSDNPGLKLPTRAKLLRWAFELQSFRYVIEHIPGCDNLWADILSRWIVQPEFKAFRHTKSRKRKPKQRTSIPHPVIRPMRDFIWPTIDDICASQSQHPPLNEKKKKLSKRNNIWYFENTHRVWIPEDDSRLQVRFFIAAHYGVGGSSPSNRCNANSFGRILLLVEDERFRSIFYS
jgi:hypothetical protein